MSQIGRLLTITRYLVLVPVIGLACAAAIFYLLGGIGLIGLVLELLADYFSLSATTRPVTNQAVVFELVEYVHTFLVGTVVFITALGLYQLFIRELPLPAWLKIHTIEELETNLIGVTVVVLAVNFMGAVLVGEIENPLSYGAGVALPIIGLALFVGMRALATWLGTQHRHPTSPSPDEAKQVAGGDEPPARH